ncbi:hypothetical protein [Aneurinibacillus uraniidurans]|uniref:hypothetical protein n=1 Tax=Aneurinibacillus uraniidurans TaxID=2966586 RepID=UPI00234BE153|nr:hypothetical protein [Aneurinibacillus sp. B1]WCN38629.1 hypothetical protein PO771_04285 [Aneurinibacillus sp. B1]
MKKKLTSVLTATILLGLVSSPLALAEDKSPALSKQQSTQSTQDIIKTLKKIPLPSSYYVEYKVYNPKNELESINEYWADVKQSKVLLKSQMMSQVVTSPTGEKRINQGSTLYNLYDKQWFYAYTPYLPLNKKAIKVKDTKTFTFIRDIDGLEEASKHGTTYVYENQEKINGRMAYHFTSTYEGMPAGDIWIDTATGIWVKQTSPNNVLQIATKFEVNPKFSNKTFTIPLPAGLTFKEYPSIAEAMSR